MAIGAGTKLLLGVGVAGVAGYALWKLWPAKTEEPAIPGRQGTAMEDVQQEQPGTASFVPEELGGSRGSDTKKKKPWSGMLQGEPLPQVD